MATKSGLSERSPLEVMVARVFNPIGPGTPATQALGQFASHLAEAGQEPLELSVGDLDSRRDFIDVRDVARAMVAIAERGPGRIGLPCRNWPSPSGWATAWPGSCSSAAGRFD